jgi:hypothetical protein
MTKADDKAFLSFLIRGVVSQRVCVELWPVMGMFSISLH